MPFCGLAAITALCTVSCAQGAAGDELERCTQDVSIEESAFFQGTLRLKKSGQARSEVNHQSMLEIVKEGLHRGDQSGCNLCAHDWVIILATGRSGSTSVLQMLNAVPGFFLAGEHLGAVKALMQFWRDVFQTPGMPTNWGPQHGVVGFKNRTDSIGPWFHEARSEKRVLCTLQQAAQTLLGDIDSSAYTTLGFKEIRYTSPEVLSFLTQLFPCARFVVNVRRDLKAQAGSGFWSRQTPKSETLRHDTAALRSWQAEDPSSRFLLELEDFSTYIFNSMLNWLGVTGCSYKQVAHANDRGSYDKVSQKTMLAGTCSTSKRSLGQHVA